MPLTISDEMLREAGLTEREALVEFSCRMFDAGKLPLWPAARLASLTRAEFQTELRQRGIPIYRPTIADLKDDLAALRCLED